MPETLYRFEASFKGEPQGCGMFTALYEVGMPDPESERIEGMFRHLRSPHLTRPASFWFTRLGLLESVDAIAYLMDTMEPYKWSLTMATTEYDTNGANVIYKDGMQVAIADECRPDDPKDYRDITPSGLTELVTALTNR